ncbi:MAG: hypothetical protein GF344_07125, partial [Chitinivibrionales bacterium]|nr:hypothetical protein [Chitinivibrionales bacterium]MBD3356684.1 hypothetical protein [Chitinivibrionales bacterium]
MKKKQSSTLCGPCVAAAMVAVVLFCGKTFSAVSVTENSASRFAFDFQLEKLSVDKISSPDGDYVDLLFADANTDIGETGEPVIPGRSVHVGVPPKGEVRVRFLPQVTKTIVLDAPLRRRSPDFVGSGGKRSDLTDRWISDVSYSMIRGHRIA